MNFLTLHVDGKSTLINMDTVTEIHANTKIGARLYFNTQVTDKLQASFRSDESISDIQDLIKELKAPNKA